MMTVFSVGWTGDWHENPKPRWILFLSGRWFLESMDGQGRNGARRALVRRRPERERGGARKGHLSGVVGDEPAVRMLIQFETAPPGPSPCPFR
jgi:hypothetical protein